MAIKLDGHGGFVVTGDHIPVYRMMVLRSALKLEIVGLKARFNAYATIKKEFGLKGSRVKVLEQFTKIVEDRKLAVSGSDRAIASVGGEKQHDTSHK